MPDDRPEAIRQEIAAALKSARALAARVDEALADADPELAPGLDPIKARLGALIERLEGGEKPSLQSLHDMLTEVQDDFTQWQTRAGGTLYCSFCGKSRHEVKKLIAGPSDYICDECVELGMEVVRTQGMEAARTRGKGSAVPLLGDIRFPRQLRAEASTLLRRFAQLVGRRYAGQDPEVTVELKPFLRLQIEMPDGETEELWELLDEDAGMARGYPDRRASSKIPRGLAMAEEDRPASAEEIQPALERAREFEARLQTRLAETGPQAIRDLKFIRAKVGAFVHDLQDGQEIRHDKVVRTLAHLEHLMRKEPIETAFQPEPKPKPGKAGATLYCSFCGKSQDEVGLLIAGPKAFICDECVELCTDIIREGPQGFVSGKGLRFPPRQQKAAMRALEKIAQFIDRHDPAGEAAITLETQTVLRMVVRTPDGKAEEVSGTLENVSASPDSLNLEPHPLKE